MTTYFGIAPLLYSYDCLIALVLSLGTLWETALGGVPLSPSMILVCRGQDCPRQRLLAVWTFFIRPQTYLPLRCGPWAWHEMDWGCQILWPHKNIELFFCYKIGPLKKKPYCISKAHLIRLVTFYYIKFTYCYVTNHKETI